MNSKDFRNFIDYFSCFDYQSRDNYISSPLDYPARARKVKGVVMRYVGHETYSYTAMEYPRDHPILRTIAPDVERLPLLNIYGEMAILLTTARTSHSLTAYLA
jgi:hypothetical protein